MIVIGKPYVEGRGQETYLCSLIKDECRNSESVYWYSVENQYGEYLCDDYADAFLLMVLPVAIKTGQDIRLESPVSSQLLHNINNTLQPLFLMMFPGGKEIRVLAQTATTPTYHAQGVGCCCSLGVDSFYSFLSHYGEDKQKEYRITHLTLFNCGQLGSLDVEGTEKNYRETIESLKPFAEEVGLPLVGVNSNLNTFFNDSGVSVLQSFVSRTISCVLALQKLFGKYIFASSYALSDFCISTTDQSHMEAAFVPLLGTHNTEIVLSNPTMTRVAKTEYLSRYPITTKYLDVCWAAQMAYGSDQISWLLEGKKHKNCGRCEKCMRTMLTLDLVGRLQPYEHLFDMEHYRKSKDKYVAIVLKDSNNNIFYREIEELMGQVGYVPPAKVRRQVWMDGHMLLLVRIHTKVRKVMRKIRH